MPTLAPFPFSNVYRYCAVCQRDRPNYLNRSRWLHQGSCKRFPLPQAKLPLRKWLRASGTVQTAFHSSMWSGAFSASFLRLILSRPTWFCISRVAFSCLLLILSCRASQSRNHRSTGARLTFRSAAGPAASRCIQSPRSAECTMTL